MTCSQLAGKKSHMTGRQLQLEKSHMTGMQSVPGRVELRGRHSAPDKVESSHVTGSQLPSRKMSYDSQSAPDIKTLQGRASVPSRDE